MKIPPKIENDKIYNIILQFCIIFIYYIITRALFVSLQEKTHISFERCYCVKMIVPFLTTK